MEKKYIETLLAQIREKRAKERIREEITEHIEDQKAAYLSEGMSEAVAEEKAVAEMGDPVEVGTALDLIHKPKPAWGMLAAIAALCAAGILLQYALDRHAQSSYGLTGNERFVSQCLYIVLGFFIMCAIYLMDYTRIAAYSRWMCVGILLLLFLATGNAYQRHFGISYLSNPLKSFAVSMDLLFYLYVPLCGAVMYSYRNCRKSELWKVFLYLSMPLALALRAGSFSMMLNLSAVLSVMLAVTISKGWYGISHRLRFFCTAAAGLLVLWLTGHPRLRSYQSARITAWLHRDPVEGSGYVDGIVRSILKGSQLVGQNTAQPIAGSLPEFSTDYMLTSLIGYYGILAAALLVLFVGMFCIRLLHISICQKNQLGMIMGLGCSLVFTIQSAEYILVNLNLLPAANVYFPLVSYGGSGMLHTCILLGILLSIYRYEDVVPQTPLKAAKTTVLSK